MALPNMPVVKKFFTNKIESSRDDWYSYLIKIARIFYELDGQPYNRDTLLANFVSMSQRDANAERDAANFRDEFGAYGTYLGIFHFEEINGVWTVVVSEAAKQFLCTENPNAAAFCRAQLAMFQYPNGAGATLAANGGIAVQANIRTDTMRELSHNIHINPFRLVCRTVVAMHEYGHMKLTEIVIPFEVLFCMVNDDRINTDYNPDYMTLLSVQREFANPEQQMAMNMEGLTNYKRNFHIFEKTGLFIRDSRLGLQISNVAPVAAYECIKAIAEMTEHFDAFDEQFGQPDEELVKEIISKGSWGTYYDAGKLPISLLESLGVELDKAPIPNRAFAHFEDEDNQSEERLECGTNILLYGVPGSGKSWTIEHEYCKPESVVERLVFHPDYTYSDFVGQIMPNVDDEGLVTYKFTAGPFTNIVRDAYENPSKEYILIIEEINRGNAPAIFGEIFQLLDRMIEPKTIGDVTYPTGTSEYGITNAYMAKQIYKNERVKVRIPSNLSIIGTMNTSDQNVFTLDTAFQRRWNMRLIENSFVNVRDSLANAQILDTEVTWQLFCTTINKLVVGNKARMASAEDKRLGVYFVHETDVLFDERAIPQGDSLENEYNTLIRAERDKIIDASQASRLSDIRDALKQNRKFPEKVIKYLWDDAFKFNAQDLFDTTRFESLEDIIRHFVFSSGRARFSIFRQSVRDVFYPA